MHPLAPPPGTPMPRIRAAVDNRGRTTARPPPGRSPPFLHRAIFGNRGMEASSIDGHLGLPALHGPGPAVPGPRLVGPARPD
jgi:hypothetical protein